MLISYLAKTANLLDSMDTEEATQAAEGIDAVLNSLAASENFASPIERLNKINRDMYEILGEIKDPVAQNLSVAILQNVQKLMGVVKSKTASVNVLAAEPFEEHTVDHLNLAMRELNAAAQEVADNPDFHALAMESIRALRTFMDVMIESAGGSSEATQVEFRPDAPKPAFGPSEWGRPPADPSRWKASEFAPPMKISSDESEETKYPPGSYEATIEEIKGLPQPDRVPRRLPSSWSTIGAVHGQQDELRGAADPVQSLKDFIENEGITPKLDDVLAYANSYLETTKLDDDHKNYFINQIKEEFSGKVEASEIIARLVRVADLLDSEGHEKSAAILDSVIKEAMELPNYPSRLETRQDLYDAPAHNKETMWEITKNEVAENRKKHHLETMRGSADSLATRYDPELPGVPLLRVSDGIYQSILTKKIYDFNEGWIGADGKKNPGGSLKHQTPLFSQYSNPSRLFDMGVDLDKKNA